MIVMIYQLLGSGKSFASPIILWLVDQYGHAALDFEPETVSEALKSVNPSTKQAVVDRVNAGLGLFTSDLFWTDPFVFGTVSRSLNRHKFPTANAPSIADLSWGVTESSILLLDPNTGKLSDRLSDSVEEFIRLTAKSEAIYTLPNALKEITNISTDFTLNDPEMLMSRQTESDADAARIDKFVADNTIEMFSQIKSLKLSITADAAKDINDIVGM